MPKRKITYRANIPHREAMDKRRLDRAKRVSMVDVILISGKRHWRAHHTLKIPAIPLGRTESIFKRPARPVLWIGKAYKPNGAREVARRLAKAVA